MKNHFLTMLLLLNLMSCASTANLSNFPQNISDVNFNSLSKQSINPNHTSWNKSGSSEYLIKIKENKALDLSIILSSALKKAGYKIHENSVQSSKLIGKRGLTMEEWSSIAAIYYKEMSKSLYYIYSC